MDYEAIARLAQRAMQGDEDAYTDLYKIFSKSAFYIAFRILKNKDDADDIAQEAMIILFKNLQKLEDAKAIVSYINKVTYSKCMDFLAKSKKRIDHTISLDEEFNLQSIADLNTEFLPEEYMAQKETREYVISVIDTLSAPLRVVTMLFYYNRYSVSKIAETLKVSENVVKTRMSRARAKLEGKIDLSKVKLTRCVVPMPVLTRMLHAHAEEIFTTEISVSIWQGIAAKLGFSPEAIERTTAIVIAGASAAAGTAATTGAAAATASATTGAITAIKTIASSVTAYTAIIATTCVATAIGGAALIYNVLDVDIFSSNVAIATAAYDAQPAYDSSQDSMLELHPGYDIAIQTAAQMSGAETTQPLPDTTYSYIASQEVTEPEAAHQSDTRPPVLPQIEAVSSQLYFPVGTAITEAQIIQAAGVSATDAAGQVLEVYVENLHEVDFNTPSRSAVHVQVIHQGQVLTQKVVIIEITDH